MVRRAHDYLPTEKVIAPATIPYIPVATDAENFRRSSGQSYRFNVGTGRNTWKRDNLSSSCSRLQESPCFVR